MASDQLRPWLALGLVLLTASLSACKTETNTDALGLNNDQIQTRAGEVAIAPLEAKPEEIANKWHYPRYPEEYDINPLDRDLYSGRHGTTETGSLGGPWLEGREALELPVAPPNIMEGENLALAISGIKLGAAAATPTGEAPTGDGTGSSAPLAGTPAGPDASGHGNGTEADPSGKTTAATSPAEAGSTQSDFGRLRQVVAAIKAGQAGALRAEFLPNPEETPFQLYLRLKEGLAQTKVAGSLLTKDQLWSLTFYLYRSVEPDFKKPLVALMDAKKVQDGAKIFGANCAMCHGADGWGRGHAGHTLTPPPANFHDPRRLFNRSETNLYRVLENGIYGSGMPPWRGKLSPDEIKHVVAYVRSFSYSLEPPLDAAGNKNSGPSSPAPQINPSGGEAK